MKTSIVLRSVAFSVLIAVAFGLRAETDPEEIIKYRQNVMKANGAHMAAISAILQGKVQYKGHLLEHAKAVQIINSTVHDLFPDGSDFGDTAALDAVWKNKPEFNKRAKDTKQKSDALLKAVQKGDVKAQQQQFKALSESCRSCHKDFRREEKE